MFDLFGLNHGSVIRPSYTYDILWPADQSPTGLDPWPWVPLG